MALVSSTATGKSGIEKEKKEKKKLHFQTRNPEDRVIPSRGIFIPPYILMGPNRGFYS